jgi:hypothetical protein
MNDLYLRFLRIVQTLDGRRNSLQDIDVTALQLLNEIAVRHFDGKTLTVSQAIALNKIASPATLHRKLDELLAFPQFSRHSIMSKLNWRESHEENEIYV